MLSSSDLPTPVLSSHLLPQSRSPAHHLIRIRDPVLLFAIGPLHCLQRRDEYTVLTQRYWRAFLLHEFTTNRSGLELVVSFRFLTVFAVRSLLSTVPILLYLSLSLFSFFLLRFLSRVSPLLLFPVRPANRRQSASQIVFPVLYPARLLARYFSGAGALLPTCASQGTLLPRTQ